MLRIAGMDLLQGQHATSPHCWETINLTLDLSISATRSVAAARYPGWRAGEAGHQGVPRRSTSNSSRIRAPDRASSTNAGD
jgi:hypothetical protein